MMASARAAGFFLAALFATAVGFAESGGEETKPPGFPPPELLGIDLTMDEDEILAHLESIGSKIRGEAGFRGSKEFWELDEGPYGFLAIRLDHDRKLEWISIFVREDADPVSYADIGDTTAAVKQGMYFYTWDVPPAGLVDGYLIQARGNDPAHLMSISLLRRTQQ